MRKMFSIHRTVHEQLFVALSCECQQTDTGEEFFTLHTAEFICS